MIPMKKHLIVSILLLLLVNICLFAFYTVAPGSIKGTVIPADAATQVWVLSAKDTLQTTVRNGSFEISGIRPGICAVVIEALPPFKRTTRMGIEVFDGAQTNLGQIQLDK
jgi:hypothetical protein